MRADHGQLLDLQTWPQRESPVAQQEAALRCPDSCSQRPGPLGQWEDGSRGGVSSALLPSQPSLLPPSCLSPLFLQNASRVRKCLFTCPSVSPFLPGCKQELPAWCLHAVTCSWACKFPGFPCRVPTSSESLLSGNDSVDFWLGSHPLVHELGAPRLPWERTQGSGAGTFFFCRLRALPEHQIPTGVGEEMSKTQSCPLGETP